MEKLRDGGAKRALKSVPRREKKVSNFMDVLRAEAKSEGKVAKARVKPSTKSSTEAKQPTGIAALRSRTTRKQQESQQNKPEVVKSSFCKEPEPLPDLPPATSQAELDDLLDQIGKIKLGHKIKAKQM